MGVRNLSHVNAIAVILSAAKDPTRKGKILHFIQDDNDGRTDASPHSGDQRSAVARPLPVNTLPATCASGVNDISTKGVLARPTGNIYPPKSRPEKSADFSRIWPKQPLLMKLLAGNFMRPLSGYR